VPDRRQLTVWGYLAVAVLGAWAICLAATRLPRGAPNAAHVHPLFIVEMTAAVAIAVAWAFWFARTAFVRLDEFQREASKVAWYWGAAGGLFAALPIYVFVAFGGLNWVAPSFGRDAGPLAPFYAFRFGFLLPILLQGLGFLVVRGWWSLSKR
jgi:hypothetical protein